MDDDQGVSFEEATGQAAPATVPAPAAPTQTAPAPGSAGRTVTVHKRAPPVPPPAPIPPHETLPLSVEPAVVAPAAAGQKPPPDEGVKFEDAAPQPTAYPGLATDVGKGVWGGLAEGAEGIGGMGRDIPNLADYGLAWAGAHINQMTGGENAQAALERTHGSLLRNEIGDDAYNKLSALNPLPSAAWLKSVAVQHGIDPDYKPQSAPGRYAHEIAAFLPGALIPGGQASLGARALQTIAPAIGSEFLGHLAEGTGYEPWARLLGAGLGGLAHAGVSGYTAPTRASGQKDLAAELAQKEATNPDAALAKLQAEQAQRQPGRATGENITGSEPTPGQITGDYGQIRAERAFQAGPGQALYGQRMGEQSAAQTKATRAIQPTGDPQSVADLITKRLQEIDAQHDLAVGARQKQHDIDTQRLTQEAQTMAGQVARSGDPADLGERARETLAASMATAKEKEEGLWRSIDPDNKIGIVTKNIAARARDAIKGMGKMEGPMEGDEKRIFENAASNLPEWTKLKDVMDLSSDLKGAMRKERATNGNTPALRRMAKFNQMIENTIANSATRASVEEAAAEREGLRGMTREDRRAMLTARAATRARGNIERGPAGEIIRKGATSDSYRTMSSQVPGKVFAAGPTGGQRLKAYTAAGGGMDPVHDIVSDSLAREATVDGMIDAKKLKTWQESHRPALEALPDQIRKKFLSGPNEAGQALAEGAAARRTALIEHSKIDIAKEMGESASAADRADPAFRGIIGKQSAKDVQDAVGGILQRPDAVTTITRLAKAVSGNPTATDGLKRAVLDHILEKTLSQAEAGTERENMLKPGAFQAFVANNKAALKAAGLSPEQLDAFDKVAADLQRQQRFNATKTRAGSDTAQNWFKLQEKGEAHHNAGWLAPLMAFKEAYEMVPESLHGVLGAGAAVAGATGYKVLSHYRNAGIAKAKDMYHEAVMNPDQMAELLARPTPGSRARLVRTLKRSALYGGLAAERHEALGPHQAAGPFGRDVYVNKRGVAANP